MKHSRRKFLQLAAVAVALPAASRVARAQAYPARPITMIVGFAAGASMDVVGRLLAEGMRGTIGQPIIIENVSGADGSVGTARAARARPDGYTIALGSLATHVLNGAFYSLRYDVLDDFMPISLLATNPFVLFARKDMPARDVNELIAWLKANPNKVSAGIVSASNRLLTAVLQKETGTKLTIVPYRANASQLQDAIAGQIDLFFATPVELPLVRAGRIKAYAGTGDVRLELAPEIPTFGEIGLPTLSYSTWYGLFAPKGTSRDVIDTLNGAVVEALADAAVRSRLVELGFELFPIEQQTPEALAAIQKADAEKAHRAGSADRYRALPRV
jgi:tripartite-type tricarboxylate transporter receptor subunit TctC